MVRQRGSTSFTVYTLLLCPLLHGGAAQYDTCTNGAIADIGNGRCDAELNVPSCGYDGGDCCSCTCVDGPLYSCSEGTFDCLYPDCGDNPASDLEFFETQDNTTKCNTFQNYPECNTLWSDCCEMDCGGEYYCDTYHFDCFDSTCLSQTVVAENPDCAGDWLTIGDEFCDSENNNPECAYDGGDCCAGTCPLSLDSACGFDGFADYSGFDCLDPAFFDPTVVGEFPECTGSWSMIGDGQCQEENNNPACGYDGGDCCICSCSGTLCGGLADCLDPSAGDEFYECSPPSPEALPCSAEVQQTWVVDEQEQAHALAAAVNCSGGSFEVEWRGTVVMEMPIVIGAGTVLTITGVDSSAVDDDDSGAVMHGNEGTRLFTVVDAALYLSNITIAFGSSTVGGAIAAAGSTLTLVETMFIANTATDHGGAIYLSEGSSMSCTGGTFAYNFAGASGGGVFVTGSSVVSCGGLWFSNEAGHSAGAIIVTDGSSLSWSEEVDLASNTAGYWGGAVYAFGDSSVSWNASTLFYNNSANYFGGAVAAANSSSVSWTGETTFDSNSAGQGGALLVYDGSSASWSDTAALFQNNTASSGGAAFIDESSALSCLGEADSWFHGNTAYYGGALIVRSGSSASFAGNFSTLDNGAYYGAAVFSSDSSVSWTEAAWIRENWAYHGGALYAVESRISWTASSIEGNWAITGGAVYAFESDVSWSGPTLFYNNSVIGRIGRGGGLHAIGSNVSWSGATDFIYNNCQGDTTDALAGCALAATDGASVSWSGGATHFTMNFGVSLVSLGGAMEVDNSEVSWSGDTEFDTNFVGFGGGAISAKEGARVSWGEGTTTFLGNVASYRAGAFDCIDSYISWSGTTKFNRNSAVFLVNSTLGGEGGAASVLSCNVSWTGETSFTSNVAQSEGGGITASSGNDGVLSNITMNATTIFFNNTAATNGGAIVLFEDAALNSSFNVDISFVGNSAGVAGGAIFLSGVDIGPIFTEVNFTSNVAEIGGAVSLFGCGIEPSGGDNPTTFDRCRFVDNQGTSTGGAIESAAGKDVFNGSIFEGNSAGTGGALRLAGSAYFVNCSFVGNTADDGEGAAVSNIGYISEMENTFFAGNRFDCRSSMYLDFIQQSDDPFEVMCSGCEVTCEACIFDEGLLVPACTDVMEHATSDGGNITLEALSIDSGYWRATESSEEVLACYHAEACVGGVTATSGYCLDGYEGPYCSVCSDGYSEQLGFVCRKCPESNKGGIAILVVLAVGALIVLAAIYSYVTSGEAGMGMGRGWIERVTRYIPLQSVKIVIAAWQILTQFTSIANVTYPDVYEDFLGVLDIFNFNLGWALSVSCTIDMDFHDRLLVSTISPIAAILFLACTYYRARRLYRRKPDKLQTVQHKHASMVLLLTFFVYSSVSSILFRSFACEELADRKIYLRSDYRIECDSSKHKSFQVYAVFMILLYTVGIPALYAGLLFRDRDVLKEDTSKRRDDPPRVTSIADLWEPYNRWAFYYEVIECGRRVLLAGVIVFIYPNTAAQIAVTLMIAFAFVVISEAMDPYKSEWDRWINRMGHVVVFSSMFLGLLLKVNVSDEHTASQRVFEVVLVAVHALMVMAIVGETVVLFFQLRAELKKEKEQTTNADEEEEKVG
ncbi:unnamed protein product [Ectocarpus sp. 12 AP-2014]